MSFVNGKKLTFDRNVFGGISMKKVLYSLWLPLFFMTMYIFVHPGPAFSKIDKNKDSQEQVVKNRPVRLMGTFTDIRQRNNDELNGCSIMLAQNSKGDVYLVKNTPPAILVFNDVGKFIFNFGRKGDRSGELIRPFGIAIDNQDMVYVCDITRGKILVYTPLGDFLEEFSSILALIEDDKYHRTFPSSIAIDKKTNQLYISDQANGHIWIHDLNGGFLRYFKGSKSGLFCTPGTLRFDVNNRIYVPEILCDRVRVFEKDGREVLEIGEGSGDLAGQFSRPNAVGVDSQGRVYVVDILLKCIQVFDSKGKFTGAIKWLEDIKKRDRIYFERPTNIYIGKDDTIFVIDRGVEQVYIIKDENPI